MQGLRWFDKLTMTSLRACSELAEGKDEGSMQTLSPRKGGWAFFSSLTEFSLEGRLISC